MTPPIFYVLLVVFSDGRLAVTDHIKSLDLCHEAESLALYGRTVEEVASDKVKYETDIAEHDKKWARENPWRAPATDWEKQIAAPGASGCVQYDGLVGPCSLEVRGGLVRRPSDLQGMPTYRGVLSEKQEKSGISATSCLEGKKT